MSSSTATAASNIAASPHQDEGVLKDVLEELDRERTKRAELEARIRMLTSTENASAADDSGKEPQARTTNTTTTTRAAENPSRKSFLTMKTQMEGYQQLVDALTIGKPAIAAAVANEKTLTTTSTTTHSNQRNSRNARDKEKKQVSTLPLHVVRLLEVIPWDPRAREYIFGREFVYEWQVYDKREHSWKNSMHSFPSVFKSLPIVKPKPGGAILEQHKERSLLVFLAGGEKGMATAPSKHGVLTNAALTQVLNIEAGFPLPEDGCTWMWVGGWRVDKRVTIDTVAEDERQKVDCDEHGWSYAREPQHFVLNPTQLVWDHDGIEKGSAPPRRIRRRKWTRQRVLVDYPFASERTQNYLKLLAENARLSITSSKISDQLVETKMTLTETEQELMRVKEDTSRQIATMKAELEYKNSLLKEAGISIGNSNATQGDAGGFLAKSEQVKDIGSKLSQWVHSSKRKQGDTSNGNSIAGEIPPQPSTVLSPNSFAWKFGRGAPIEKIKQTQGSAGAKPDDENETTVVDFTDTLTSLEDPEVEPE